MELVVADSSTDIIRGLLQHLADRPLRHFVDFGCGRGRVLMPVAERYPDVPCVGIDIDADCLAEVATRVDRLGLTNVNLVQGDVLENTQRATDVAYLYLGGALNQRLGHSLLERGRCQQIVAARYPVTGCAATKIMALQDSSLFVYDRCSVGRTVEWDSAATYVRIPRSTRYLLSRALRFNTAGEAAMTTEYRTVSRDVTVVGTECGFSPVRQGVPTVYDCLLQAGAVSSEPTVIELATAVDGVTLRPAHTIVAHIGEYGEIPMERSFPTAAQLTHFLHEMTSAERNDR